MSVTSCPEPKSPTEPFDVGRMLADTMAGKRPVNSRTYPYFPPDYEIPYVHIGSERQLLIDNFIVNHLDGVERVFPTPLRLDRPIVTAREFPWEPNFLQMPVAALYDPNDHKYKLWYTQSLTNEPANRGQVLCYAESADCVCWEKPLNDRCLPFGDNKATNIVERDTAEVGLAMNYDQTNTERRFLLVYVPYAKAKDRGQRIMSTAAASPDGLRWTTISEDNPYRHQHESRIIWDESIQRWIAYSQYSHHWNFLHRQRQVGRQESADFIHWSPKEVVLSTDWDPNLPPQYEYHDMSVRKIGSLYLGIATQFMTEPGWSVRDGNNWRDTARAAFCLLTSRDGKRWQRVGGAAPWLAPREPGSIDYGGLAYSVAGQLLHKGKIYIAYGARNEKQQHYDLTDRTVARAETWERGREEWTAVRSVMGDTFHVKREVGMLFLREDGWAALRPVYEWGRVYTKQFVFEGDTLRINADCRGGYIQVDVLDPSFVPYPGFSARECDPIHSADPDQIWHTVRWQAKSDVRPLWNRPIRLVFHLHRASLYSFQFEHAASD